MTYRIEIMPPAQRSFDGLPEKVQRQVTKRLRALANDPRPTGAIPLKGDLAGSYRIRVGRYRVGYDVDDRAHLVRVWQIGYRSRFYDKARRRGR